jgi:hypothetical protein
LAFGAARTSADVAKWEMDVMAAPGRVDRRNVAAGNPIQQGQSSENQSGCEPACGADDPAWGTSAAVRR